MATTLAQIQPPTPTQQRRQLENEMAGIRSRLLSPSLSNYDRSVLAQRASEIAGKLDQLSSEASRFDHGGGLLAFLPARGAFTRVALTSKDVPGIYGIKEFEPYEQALIEADQRSLLDSVTLSQQDIVRQIACLENAKVLHTFGQNFGNVVISGRLFLGPMGFVTADAFNVLRQFFYDFRVSRYKKPITVSVTQGEAVYVYLTRLDIMQTDPEFHVMPFQMHGILLDLNYNDAQGLNPAGTVVTGDMLDDPAALGQLLVRQDLEQDPEFTVSEGAQVITINQVSTKAVTEPQGTSGPSALHGGRMNVAAKGRQPSQLEKDAELQADYNNRYKLTGVLRDTQPLPDISPGEIPNATIGDIGPYSSKVLPLPGSNTTRPPLPRAIPNTLPPNLDGTVTAPTVPDTTDLDGLGVPRSKKVLPIPEEFRR